MGSEFLKQHTKRFGKSPTRRSTVASMPSDRAARRVIAPYMNIVRKSKKDPLKDENADRYIEAFLRRKPSILTSTLKEFVDGIVELPTLVHESVDALRVATRSIGARLYIVDDIAGEIFISPKGDPYPRNRLSFKIETGRTVAAHVAATREVILTDDILIDTRFPEGIAFVDMMVMSVLCAPILTTNDTCFGIVELYRDCTQRSFSKANTKIVLVLLGWIGTAIQRNNESVSVSHQRRLNDCLIELTKSYFANNITIDKVINELVMFAKSAVNAERASLFVIRPENEMVADVYDQSLPECGDNLVKRFEKVKFSKEKGIAAHVARTRECVVVKNAYDDPRFNKEIDQNTGLITRSVLCVPILGMNRLLGIIQAVNKAVGECFTAGDEELFKTFAVYCGLALQYNDLSKLHKEVNARYQIMADLMRRHVLPPEREIEQLKADREFSDTIEQINRFDWYIKLEHFDQTPQIAVYLVMSAADKDDIDVEQLYKFVLSIRQFYRNNPYHNWEHAFNVGHCMSTMLNHNRECFTSLERKALVISALGHDVDHSGVTNSFLHLTNDIMAELYEESTWEYHHFDITMTLLNQIPIYNSCSNEEYKEITNLIQTAILATDLVNYFKTSTKLGYLLDDDLFDVANPSHKAMMIGTMMTVSDLSGQCKDFAITNRITMCLYEEFYKQGDMEKQYGYMPLSMMDRERRAFIPGDQVNFLDVLVLPCCALLMRCLPNINPLYDKALELKETWLAIAENKRNRLWVKTDVI